MILNAGVLTVWVDRHDSVSQVRSFLTPSSLVAMKCGVGSDNCMEPKAGNPNYD